MEKVSAGKVYYYIDYPQKVLAELFLANETISFVYESGKVNSSLGSLDYIDVKKEASLYSDELTITINNRLRPALPIYFYTADKEIIEFVQTYYERYNEEVNKRRQEEQDKILEAGYVVSEQCDKMLSNFIKLKTHDIFLDIGTYQLFETFLYPFTTLQGIVSVSGDKAKLLNEKYDNTSVLKLVTQVWKDFLLLNQLCSEMLEGSQQNDLVILWSALKVKTCEFYSYVFKSEYPQFEFTQNAAQMIHDFVWMVNGKPNYREMSLYTYHVLHMGNGATLPISSICEQFCKMAEIEMKIYAREELRSLLADGDNDNDRISIEDIDKMTGEEFEIVVAKIFKGQGYVTEITKKTGDQGIDVIAEKNGVRIGIQAKCYSGTVGNSAIQEAVAGKSFYHLDKVMVITNSTFTVSALELAGANDVVLWDRDMLKDKIMI